MPSASPRAKADITFDARCLRSPGTDRTPTRNANRWNERIATSSRTSRVRRSGHCKGSSLGAVTIACRRSVRFKSSSQAAMEETAPSSSSAINFEIIYGHVVTENLRQNFHPHDDSFPVHRLRVGKTNGLGTFSRSVKIDPPLDEMMAAPDASAGILLRSADGLSRWPIASAT